jgi:hypothetical protein
VVYQNVFLFIHIVLLNFIVSSPYYFLGVNQEVDYLCFQISLMDTIVAILFYFIASLICLQMIFL